MTIRGRTGAAALAATLAAAAALAGCSTSTPAASSSPTNTATSSTSSGGGDAHARAVQLVQTVIPGADTAQAEDMMRSACQLIDRDPTPSGVLAVRADLVRRGVGTPVEVTTLLAAAVAGQCPQHLPALPAT